MLRSSKIAKAILLAGLAFAVLPVVGFGVLAQQILPEGLTQFTDGNGAPLAAGNVYFYIPNTTTGKTTWSDSALSVPNANPVPLDAAGRAPIWGKGSYRQIVKDVNGNTIWDRVTSATDWSNVAITGGSITGVTLSGSSLVTNSVSNSALAQMPTKTVKSNLLSGTANAADNTVSSVLDVIGSTQGSVMYRGASAWLLLTPGTSGQFLQTTGAGSTAVPVWTSVPNVAPAFSGLVITASAGSSLTLTANSALLNNGTVWQSVFSPSLTISTVASGANGLDVGAVANSTWYAVWIIYNPTTSTVAGLLSLSATAPTLPSGYTFKVRAGWVRYATGALAQTLQIGSRVQYVVTAGSQTPNMVLLGTGPAGTGGTANAAVAWGSCAPTTSASISLVLTSDTYYGQIVVAPNTSYGAITSTTNPPFASLSFGGDTRNSNVPVDMIPESSNIYWYALYAGNLLWCKGWNDNL